MKTNMVYKKASMQKGTGLEEINQTRKSTHYNIFKSKRAKKLYQLGVPLNIICTDLYISRSTLYRYLKNEGLNLVNYIRQGSKIENLDN